MKGARARLTKRCAFVCAWVAGGFACTAEISDGGGNIGGILMPDGGRTEEFVASPSVARRLSQAELDNSLRDILGETARPAQKYLPEDEYTPYDNDHTLQQASSALIDSIEALAEDVAKRTLADPARRARVVSCTPATPTDSDCFRQVVSEVGRRFFRRPLTEAELTAYMSLLPFAGPNSEGVATRFDTAVELLLRSIIQDPEFLYRVEAGTATQTSEVFALDDYAIATRLAYTLWGTTPSDALLDRARQGGLANSGERRQVAEQMLLDPKAREQLHRFHALWLGYRAIPHPADLVSEFDGETSALIDRVVFEEQRSYLDLFLLDETRITDKLATLYGLPAPPQGGGWVKYGDTGRAGILSHGSVLSAFSKFSDTSPTQRGILVRTRLLCEDGLSPPANVDVDHPPGDPQQTCKYDRYAQHRASSSCAHCHDQLDPVGFGLENYDIQGRFRAHDDGLPECAIAGNGSVSGIGAFKGPGELAALLVSSKRLEACVVRQLYEFAVGHEVYGDESEAVSALVASFEGGGYALDQLLLRYVESPAFVLRKEPSE
jgi:hypothetical protein